eukprot:1275829-Rhodomonas_salina.1
MSCHRDGVSMAHWQEWPAGNHDSDHHDDILAAICQSLRASLSGDSTVTVEAASKKLETKLARPVRGSGSVPTVGRFRRACIQGPATTRSRQQGE